MQNKKLITSFIIIFILSSVIVSYIIFFPQKENQYIYFCSATLTEANTQSLELAKQGWNCNAPTRCSNGLYSLYCEPPSCQDECVRGEDKCSGNHYLICVLNDYGCTEWQDYGIILNKCGVECKSDNNCKDYEVCNNYKCEGKQPDPCKGVNCEDKCVGMTYYFNGYCEDGQCKYSTMTCISPQICSVEKSGCVTPSECQYDTDCQAGYECINGQCKPKPNYCYSDINCQEDEYCDLINHVCKKQEKSSLVPLILISGGIIGILIAILVKRKRQ